MIVVAHQDDDITFFNPDASADIAAGRCVRIVYLTAGDAGKSRQYWATREVGAQRAHETMAGVGPAALTDSSLTVRGHVLAHRALASAPNIDMVFMRLPEGGDRGEGFERNGYQSLRKLAKGEIAAISTVPDAADDGLAATTSYSGGDLEKTLLALIESFGPDRILVQNYLAKDTGEPDADVSDHIHAARFAAGAAKSYARRKSLDVSSLLVGYRGEEIAEFRQNVSGARLDAALASFASYASADKAVCADPDCSSYRQSATTFRGYPRWLRRQYRLEAPKPILKATEIRGLTTDGLTERCLDLKGSGASAGALVVSASCGGAGLQKWRYDPAARTIKAGATKDLCLRTLAYPPPKGGQLEITRCDGSKAQRWRLMATGEFVNASGMCLDASGAIDKPVTVEDCGYLPNQLWGYGSPAPGIAPLHVFSAAFTLELCLAQTGSRYATVDTVVGRYCGGAKRKAYWRFPPGGQMRASDGRCLDIERPASPGGGRAVTRACDRNDPDLASASQNWAYSEGFLTNRRDQAAWCLAAINPDGLSPVQVQVCSDEAAGQQWTDLP